MKHLQGRESAPFLKPVEHEQRKDVQNKVGIKEGTMQIAGSRSTEYETALESRYQTQALKRLFFKLPSGLAQHVFQPRKKLQDFTSRLADPGYSCYYLVARRETCLLNFVSILSYCKFLTISLFSAYVSVNPSF